MHSIVLCLAKFPNYAATELQAAYLISSLFFPLDLLCISIGLSLHLVHFQAYARKDLEASTCSVNFEGKATICRQGKDAEESSKGDKDRKPISWQAWKGPEHSEKQAANTREKEEKPVKEIQAKGEQPPLMKAERSKPASRPKDCSRDRDRLPPSKAAPSSSKRHVQLRRQSPPPRGRSPPRKKRSPPPSHRQQRRETPPRGRSPPHLRHSMSRRHSPPAQRRHSTHRSRSLPPLIRLWKYLAGIIPLLSLNLEIQHLISSSP